jgi:hypothetical protein
LGDVNERADLSGIATSVSCTWVATFNTSVVMVMNVARGVTSSGDPSRRGGIDRPQ